MVRMVPRAYKKKKKWRIVSLWILGSFCMLVGSMVAGQLQRMTGAGSIVFLIAFILSLMFFLTAGLLWISVSSP